MIQQTGNRVFRMFLHEQRLKGHHVDVFAFTKRVGKLHRNRSGHVQAVEPNLVRVMPFVPESAGFVRWPRLQQRHKRMQRFFVPLVSGLFVKGEKKHARLDVVQFIRLEFFDASVLKDLTVDPTLHIVI
ncbi:hypothetical protein D1872_271430 [compost metagenome]